MNISYNWLKRYIDTDLGAEEVARILTDIGLEVEGFEKIETIKGGLAGVVVGEVLSCEDHPDSDHLHVTTVDVGTGEPLQIVCGAPNCRAGLKVLCATVGAVLYPGGGDEEFKIKRSKIRGVESLGMLCAEDELGIGASHDGIMELPADAVAGTTARDYLRIEDDYLIEVGLTPNRVDAAFAHRRGARPGGLSAQPGGRCFGEDALRVGFRPGQPRPRRENPRREPRGGAPLCGRDRKKLQGSPLARVGHRI